MLRAPGSTAAPGRPFAPRLSPLSVLQVPTTATTADPPESPLQPHHSTITAPPQPLDAACRGATISALLRNGAGAGATRVGEGHGDGAGITPSRFLRPLGKTSDPGGGKGRGAVGGSLGVQPVSRISSQSRRWKDTFSCRINPRACPGPHARGRCGGMAQPAAAPTAPAELFGIAGAAGVSRGGFAVSPQIIYLLTKSRKGRKTFYFSSFLLWKQEKLITEVLNRGLFFGLSHTWIIMR